MTRNQITAAILAVVALAVGAIAWNTYRSVNAPTSQPGIDAIDDALRQIPGGISNP